MANLSILLCLASAVFAVNPRLVSLSSSGNTTPVASSFLPRDSPNKSLQSTRKAELRSIKCVKQDIRWLERYAYLLQSYYNGQAGGCAIINALDSDGNCASQSLTPTNGVCSAYCEVRVFLSYGREVPYPRGQCRSPDSCTITTSQSVTVEQSFSFNIKGGANLGKRDESKDALRNRGVNLLEALSGAFDVVSPNNSCDLLLNL